MTLSLSDVNRGSAPGDGTGETAYTAFGKVNTNNSLIETIVDSLAGRFWTIQNSSTTLVLGGRYKANNHAGITFTLPATFAQTTGTMSDIWIQNIDTDFTVTIDPAAGDTLYLDGAPLAVDETYELLPGSIAILSTRTANSEWDLFIYVRFPEGVDIKSTGETGSTKALKTVGNGSCVWGVVLSPEDVPLDNFAATVAPTVNDDVNDGYTIGSRWIDIVADKEYVCVAASPAGSAVWKEVTNTSGSSPLNNFSAAGEPTVNDDANDGYTNGSLWLIPSAGWVYMCRDNTVGAADWVLLAPEIDPLLHNFGATVDPTNTDDTGLGYSRGSRWINTTDDTEFVCTDNTASAAVWKQTSELSGTFTPTILDDTLSASESQTYTARTGVYRKSGDMVHFWIDITVNSLGTLTTTQQARVGGLPFTAGSAIAAAVTVGYGTSLAITAGHKVSGTIAASVAYISLWKWSAAAGSTALTLAELSTGGQLILSGSYLV